jgi:hypothetical protein
MILLIDSEDLAIMSSKKMSDLVKEFNEGDMIIKVWIICLKEDDKFHETKILNNMPNGLDILIKSLIKSARGVFAQLICNEFTKTDYTITSRQYKRNKKLQYKESISNKSQCRNNQKNSNKRYR